MSKAGEKGLYIGLLPTWGNQVVGASWEKSPPIIFTAANARGYGRFLGTRYRSSPNLIWILGGDRDPRGVETVWRAMAGGPTTSVREEPYEHYVIRRWGVRAVLGKGGMGGQTLEAMKDAGAVYLHAIGGAAQVYARAIEKVPGVYLMEFGVPEAMWHLKVKDFLAIVTMDAHGNSLHAAVEAETGAALAELQRV